MIVEFYSSQFTGESKGKRNEIKLLFQALMTHDMKYVSQYIMLSSLIIIINCCSQLSQVTIQNQNVLQLFEINLKLSVIPLKIK